jgi:hypothetical protein
MKDGWKITEKPDRWAGKVAKVYVSLNGRGEIVMNRRAFESIGRPASVTLLYDEKARRIAVKYPVREDKFFFKVRHCGRGGQNLIIRAARMLRQFGLKMDATCVFKDVRTEDVRGHNALLLDLNTAEPLRRRPRSNR